MRVTRVGTVDRDRFRADGPGWTEVAKRSVSLQPVPVNAVDTSRYVRDTVREAEIGSVESVSLAGAHDGERVAVYLEWQDDRPVRTVTDSTEFADKAAVAFPLAPGASVMTMGSVRAPINAWYWRADRSQPYDVLAEGLGETTRREPTESALEATGAHEGGRWRVAFQRPLAAPNGSEYVDLGGGPDGVAIAVWDGENGERGPLKGYSGEFRRVIWE